MTEFNWSIVIIILMTLVIADKAITIINLKTIEKNFPEVDTLKAEKNPLARFFFNKFGIYGGSFLYAIISLITVILFILLLSFTLNAFKITNSLSIALYIAMLWYGFVIFNNLYFFLKFSKIIP